MIAFDFLQRPLAHRVVADRRFRIAAALSAFLAIVGFIEGLRLYSALQTSRAVEARRDALAADVAKRLRSDDKLSARRRALASLLLLRARNADAAANLARVGNVVRPSVALTALRRIAGGLEIEGRSPTVGEVAATVRAVSTSTNAAMNAFSLQRDGDGRSYVSFTFTLLVPQGER